MVHRNLNTASFTCLVQVIDHSSHTWAITFLPDELCSALNTLMATMGAQLLELLPSGSPEEQAVNTLTPVLQDGIPVSLHGLVSTAAGKRKGQYYLLD